MKDQHCQNQMIIRDHFYGLLMTFQMSMVHGELNLNIIFNPQNSPELQKSMWNLFGPSVLLLSKLLLESKVCYQLKPWTWYCDQLISQTRSYMTWYYHISSQWDISTKCGSRVSSQSKRHWYGSSSANQVCVGGSIKMWKDQPATQPHHWQGDWP